MWVALTEQFTATGRYSDGTSKDLTSVASWSSSPANMVSVAAGGAITPLSAGAVTITASSGGARGSANENIVGLTTAYISPSGAVLSLTGSPSSAQLSAFGVWADGKTVDVSSGVSWSSSNSNVATVSSAGNVTRSTNPGLENGYLSGTYVFLLNGVDPGGPAFYSGLFTANGSGNVTGELVSSSDNGIVPMPAAFIGTYTVFPDGRGDMTLALPPPFTTTKLRFALGSNGDQGRFILFDAGKPTAMVGAFQRPFVRPSRYTSLDS